MPGANDALAHLYIRVCASRRKHILAVGVDQTGNLSHPAAGQRMRAGESVTGEYFTMGAERRAAKAVTLAHLW